MENNQAKKSSFSTKPRKILSEVSDATTEAVFAMANTIDNSPIGSIFINMREFGLMMNTADSYQNRFISRMCEYYDGVITSKITKGEDFEKNIKDITVNALMYSDYSAFENEIKSKFTLLMKTGFARRCMISFDLKSGNPTAILSKKEELEWKNSLKSLGDRIFNTFKDVQVGIGYELSDEAFDRLNQYKIKNNSLIEEEDDVLCQKELTSRHLKAIKLSGLYACISHPKDNIINVKDVEQAIYCIDFMSKHFKKFYNHKPLKKDAYEDCYKWFKDRVGQTFTKTELTKKYFREFGYSRLNFIKEFDAIMSGIAELAECNGYVFINQKSGRNRWDFGLIKPENKEVSQGVKGLDEIMSTSVTNTELSKSSLPLGSIEPTNTNNITNLTDFTGGSVDE